MASFVIISLVSDLFHHKRNKTDTNTKKRNAKIESQNVSSIFNFGKPNIIGINQFHIKHIGILSNSPIPKNVISDLK